MAHTSVEALLEAGSHFGHLTRRWNPKMRSFIFMERNGIHIIDLRKTQALVDIARDAVLDIVSSGRTILFVGTKTQAKDTISGEAQRASSNYVSERWLGGMLTNFQTIRKSIKRLSTIDRMESDGTFEKLTKKERLMLSRERDRLRKTFGGIEDMTRLPGALFVVDTKREHLAVKEAQTLGIPVIGIVDTNCDPDHAQFPIPANDDSIKSVELITKVIADAVIEGREVARAKGIEFNAAPEMGADRDGDDRRNAPQRRMRERRGGPGGQGGPGQGPGGGRRESGRQSYAPGGTMSAPAPQAEAAPAPDAPASDNGSAATE